MPPVLLKPDMPGTMGVYVGLLRGINVGGKNRLPMARLRDFFEQAGAKNVSTYIQSGNVVYSASSKKRAEAIARDVTELLLQEEGLAVPLLVRTQGELEKVLSMHPYLKDEADGRMVSVVFLSSAAAASSVASLDPHKSSGDRFLLKKKEIFLHTPNGSARSKLTVAYFDRALGLVSTVRNIKTVRALLEMCERA